jgi:hypothetical protein
MSRQGGALAVDMDGDAGAGDEAAARLIHA